MYRPRSLATALPEASDEFVVVAAAAIKCLAESGTSRAAPSRRLLSTSEGR